NYLSDEPVLVFLDGYLNNTNNLFERYDLLQQTNGGKVEILADKFLLYTPESNTNDFTSLAAKSKDGATLVNANFRFQNTNDACGIARFSGASIESGGFVEFTLADPDLLCTDRMRSGVIGGYYIGDEGGDGTRLSDSTGEGFQIYLDLSIQRVYLDYKAPENFKGIAKMAYVVGINRLNQSNTSNANITPKDYEYYLTGIAEVEVK
ncbi:MAG TPA: hypothetical protein PKC24_07000, partial [Cyclobacteriaceae bacterium]|nr:hypothetical protein [Cyclobacteriaceae bacterium]